MDEKKVADATPVTLDRVPPDVSLHIEMRKPGYKTAVRLMNLQPGETKEVFVSLSRLTEPAKKTK